MRPIRLLRPARHAALSLFLAAGLAPALAQAESDEELRLPDHSLAAYDDVGRALFVERESQTVLPPRFVRKRSPQSDEAPAGQLREWPEAWAPVPAAPADDR